MLNKIKKVMPVKWKRLIAEFLFSFRRIVNMILGKMVGVKIAFPNPQSPLYYLYKSEFNKNNTIVDVGCGFDADFSIYMIQKYGVTAIGIDPTLKHKDSLKKLENVSNGKFRHMLAAVSSKDGKISFNESIENVSGSIMENHRNIKNKEVKKYEVESISLKNLAQYLNLPKINYIKLDIEGAEYDLIDKINKEDLEKYDEIFIEFHHHAIPQYSKEDTLKRVRKIEALGFRSFSVDNHNYLFFRN